MKDSKLNLPMTQNLFYVGFYTPFRFRHVSLEYYCNKCKIYIQKKDLNRRGGTYSPDLGWSQRSSKPKNIYMEKQISQVPSQWNNVNFK